MWKRAIYGSSPLAIRTLSRDWADGTEFLLVFNQGGFSEDGTMLISEWLAHTPPEVLAKNTGLDASCVREGDERVIVDVPSYIHARAFPARTLGRVAAVAGLLRDPLARSALGAQSLHAQTDVVSTWSLPTW